MTMTTTQDTLSVRENQIKGLRTEYEVAINYSTIRRPPYFGWRPSKRPSPFPQCRTGEPLHLRSLGELEEYLRIDHALPETKEDFGKSICSVTDRDNSRIYTFRVVPAFLDWMRESLLGFPQRYVHVRVKPRMADDMDELLKR